MKLFAWNEALERLQTLITTYIVSSIEFYLLSPILVQGRGQTGKWNEMEIHHSHLVAFFWIELHPTILRWHEASTTLNAAVGKTMMQ